MSAFLPESERWSIRCLIGHVLFGAHPVFFLNEISAASVDEYARTSPGWPLVDTKGPLFTKTPENRAAYPALLRRFESVPPGVAARFRELFLAGLNATARPAAPAWVVALSTMCEPPEFVEVTVADSCSSPE